MPLVRRTVAPRSRSARVVRKCRVLLKIVQAGDPVLRTPARPLTPADLATAELQQLIELMRETMRDAPGVGLAAPQVGVPLQLAVIEDVGENAEQERAPVPFHVIASPRLTLGDELVALHEGCLSVEGFQAVVPRARAVTVEALDHHGAPVTIRASGWYARILQHEIDHLSGALYVDRMRSVSLCSLDNFTRHWKGKTIAEVKQLLS
jgi:peptide deformylase